MLRSKNKIVYGGRAGALLGAALALSCGAEWSAGLDADWVVVPAGDTVVGEFDEDWIPPPPGSPPSTPPYFRVEIESAFTMLPTEVTRRDFRARLGFDPSAHQAPHATLIANHCLGLEEEQAKWDCLQGLWEGQVPESYLACAGDCPVEQVTWHQAAAYCNTLSDADGRERCYACEGDLPDVTCAPRPGLEDGISCRGYRLPTVPEREHAARAGDNRGTYITPFAPLTIGWESAIVREDVLSRAWLSANSQGSAHPVAMRQANRWGLYDLVGNVAEWCHGAWLTELVVELQRERVEFAAARLELSTDEIMFAQAETMLEMQRSFLEQYQDAVARGIREQRGLSFRGGVQFHSLFTEWGMQPDTAEPDLGFRPVRTLHDD